MSLLDMLTNGANIGYCGPHYSRSTPNAATARTFSEALSSSIAQEISLFHSVGPFPSPPFPNMVISSLGVRPKKNGKFRIIMDLSRPFFYSVNDYIDRDCYSMQYCRVDDAVNHLCSVGPGAVMAKLDVKHAFRLIPVRSEDWHLLGYQFNDFYYFDIVLPFGLRSSPFLFCQLSEAVLWIFKHVTGHQRAFCHVDDFLFITEPDRSACQLLINKRFFSVLNWEYQLLQKRLKGLLVHSHS